jgi:hypothetical protein
VKWDDAILPFDPFDTVDIEKLLGREMNLPIEREWP